MDELRVRAVVPTRLALICRAGQTVGYNPNLNVWHRLDDDVAEVLRWLRAGRDRAALPAHLGRRFHLDPTEAEERLGQIVRWAVLRRLLFLDAEPKVEVPHGVPTRLATVYWICTQACNLRCVYCYQEATVPRPHELSTQEGFDLVDQAVEVGARTFVFTGGEPFSRRDVLDIARYSRAGGFAPTSSPTATTSRPDESAPWRTSSIGSPSASTTESPSITIAAAVTGPGGRRPPPWTSCWRPGCRWTSTPC